jgi:hypothetical protein
VGDPAIDEITGPLQQEQQRARGRFARRRWPSQMNSTASKPQQGDGVSERFKSYIATSLQAELNDRCIRVV